MTSGYIAPRQKDTNMVNTDIYVDTMPMTEFRDIYIGADKSDHLNLTIRFEKLQTEAILQLIQPGRQGYREVEKMH